MKKYILLAITLALNSMLCYSQVNIPQSHFKGGVDTVNAQIDTLSRKLSSTSTTLADFYGRYYQGYIAPDDTIEVSEDISFPSTNTTEILGGEVFQFGSLSPDTATNIYIRRKGTGSPRWRWNIGGY